MTPAEAHRLFQAALEEQRSICQRTAGDVSDDAIEEREHIGRQVSRAYAECMRAVWL